MRINAYFETLKQYIEYLTVAKKNASLERPMIYPISLTVASGETNEAVITITSEGDFIAQYLSAQFDFDSESLPQVSMRLVDTSNGQRALTSDWVPLSLIASVGKTGNQLLNLFPFEHLFEKSADLTFEFKNDGDLDSTVKIALIGRQLRN